MSKFGWCCFCSRLKTNHEEEEDKVLKRSSTVLVVDNELEQSNLEEENLIRKDSTMSVKKKEIIIGKYVALYDFEADDEDDVSFEKGHIIEIEESIEYIYTLWCKGTNLHTGQKGYVPITYLARYLSLESEPWYFNITSFAAETYLLMSENPEGTFLVRPGALAPYALSVRCKNEAGKNIVKHYLIRQDSNKDYYISQNAIVRTLPQLVEMYMSDTTNCLQLCTKITQPCPKLDPEIYALSGNYRKIIEIERSEVTTGNVIGEGISSIVYLGKWKSKAVAIKTLKAENIDIEEFLEEANTIKKLQHKNIVTMYGVCSKEKPCYILLEFMCNGSLLNCLKKTQLTLNEQLYICQQLCDGMIYLEERKVIHRDLAARNILVGNNLIVKISDFGLSKFLRTSREFVMTEDKQLPIRWLAPESFFLKKFSHKSDVWSYGLLMLEIFTNGTPPYADCESKKLYNTFNSIKNGYRIPQPNNVDKKIYSLMLECWDIYPEVRPDFKTICFKILKLEK